MAMSDKHRKLLITNRVDLVKDMQIDEELLSRLMGAGILTGDMKEQIEVGVMFLIFCVESVESLIFTIVCISIRCSCKSDDCYRYVCIAFIASEVSSSYSCR